MKRIVLTIALLSAALSLTAQNQPDKGFEIAKNLEIFANVYRNIHLNYVDDIDPGKTMKTAIDAMLASLDPYTNYYPESDIEDVKMQMLGQYGGIGSIIQQRDSNVYIAEPYEGMPADKAGLKAGDRIVSINGTSCKGKTTADVSGILRGQAGTSLTIRIERDGKEMEKKLTREEIKMPNMPYYGMVQGNCGYIKLDEFTQDAGKNVRTAFAKLKKEHPEMKGVILDLRGNGGGLMNEAVDIVNVWMKRGEVVVETKGKVASKNIKSVTTQMPEDTEMPVAVLIDGSSASASEIVSGSLQDFDRAVIIGSRSYGKGLVQNILPMAYNSQMKVTVSKYYIPSGRCIQAIDYTHRDENGKALKVPDSLKTAFKTRNGRTVYDGFGIEPDVEIEPEYMSGLAIALVQKQLVFDYATKFSKEHPSIAPAGEFEITDEIYDDFVKFLSDKSYDYSTFTERMLGELRKVAKEEQYIDALDEEIKQLEQKLKDDKAADIKKHRDEISEMLRNEILVRYYYQKGRIEGAIKNDPVVKKAAEILNDKEQYRKLLGK
ncbi:MAG: S41 family peptidase [Bacteroidales bacterium]|nr:S41 family peptidase [Bacteroidales bacterium]